MLLEPKNEYEKSQIVKTLHKLYRAAAFVEPSVIEVTQNINYDIPQALKDFKWEENQKTMAPLLNGLTKSRQQQDLVAQCKANIAMALSSAPSSLRERKSLELFEKVKSAAKTAAASYFSGSDLETLRTHLDKTFFTKIASSDEIKTNNLQLLKDIQADIERQKILLKGSERNETFLSSFAVLTLQDLASEENMFSSLRTVCEKMAPSFFEDSADPNVNMVRVGWQSVVFPEVGMGVIAHELGHILSYKYSRDINLQPLFRDTRMCSAKKHADLAGSSDVTKYEGFAEEDWADSFAATTLKVLEKSSPQSQNYACALLSVNQDKMKLQDLNLVSTNSQIMDTHSQSLLRALLFQTNMGRPLPQSCLGALTESEKSVVLKTCEK